MLEDVIGTITVTGICASAMAMGSLSLLVVRIPGKVEAATQNFSAGILIAAIAGELFPFLHRGSQRRLDSVNTLDLSNSTLANSTDTTHISVGDSNLQDALAMFVGFVAGLLLMFGQKHIFEHDENERKQDHGGAGLAQLDCVLSDEPTVNTESSADQITRAHSSDVDSGSPSTNSRRDFGSMRRLERATSEKIIQGNALKIVGDMKEISDKVQGILSQPSCSNMRDMLDDELSELHMLLGVLRRHIRGAEPMTKEQVDQVVRKTKAVELFISRLEKHLKLPKFSVQTIDTALSQIEDELRNVIHSQIDAVHKFRRWQPTAPKSGRKTEKIPWSLVTGVSIDCLVDGLLVGLTYTASHRAGYIMALATSIESCFLGLSLSSMINNATASRFRHLVICTIPLFTMLCGGAVAGVAGSTLDKTGPVFIGFIMFAIVSLLFLVTQELLLTAHSITDEKAIWYININLFMGVGLVVFIEKLVPA